MFPLAEQTIGTLTDNTPALAWQTKGSTTTTGPAAYLLRLQALHQWEHQYFPQLAHIPGPINVMADDCLRRWDLLDDALLSHFNTHYPQERPWHLCHLRQDWHLDPLPSCNSRRERTGPTQISLAVELWQTNNTRLQPGDQGTTSAPKDTNSMRIPDGPTERAKQSKGRLKGTIG